MTIEIKHRIEAVDREIEALKIKLAKKDNETDRNMLEYFQRRRVALMGKVILKEGEL